MSTKKRRLPKFMSIGHADVDRMLWSYDKSVEGVVRAINEATRPICPSLEDVEKLVAEWRLLENRSEYLGKWLVARGYLEGKK